MKLTFAATALALAALPQPQPASAQQKAPVILSVVDDTKGGERTDLTLDDLQRLGGAVIRTTTPWHDGEQVFEGVPLASLLAHLGTRGHRLTLTALNSYMTEIPVADATQNPVLLAYKRNGQTIPATDKGPLFAIYPHDADKELKTETYFSRSAWQVRSIAID
jgi:hypothetical protein